MYPLSLFSFLYLYQTWTLVLNQANVFLFSVFHHLINTSWAIALRLPLYGYSGKVVLKGLVHLHLAINWQTFEVVWQVRHTYTVLLNDTKDTVSKHCIIMLSSNNKAGTAHKAMAAYTSKFLLVLVMWVFFLIVTSPGALATQVTKSVTLSQKLQLIQFLVIYSDRLFSCCHHISCMRLVMRQFKKFASP